MRSIILAAGLLAAAPAFAQTTPAATKPAAPSAVDTRGAALIGQLETFRDKEMFRLADTVRGVTFKALDEKSWTFTVDPGKTYRLVAMCDENCEGVELAAEDANEADLGHDFGKDPVAMIDLKPGVAGSKLMATLFPAACAKDECLAAIALFEVLKPR